MLLVVKWLLDAAGSRAGGQLSRPALLPHWRVTPPNACSSSHPTIPPDHPRLAHRPGGGVGGRPGPAPRAGRPPRRRGRAARPPGGRPSCAAAHPHRRRPEGAGAVTGWRDRAACVAPAIDPELFFPAKRVCARCPVRVECLADALACMPTHDDGIRGGLTLTERRALRRERVR